MAFSLLPARYQEQRQTARDQQQRGGRLRAISYLAQHQRRIASPGVEQVFPPAHSRLACSPLGKRFSPLCYAKKLLPSLPFSATRPVRRCYKQTSTTRERMRRIMTRNATPPSAINAYVDGSGTWSMRRLSTAMSIAESVPDPPIRKRSSR